jgi:GT2 family glycosyltransferase
LSPTSIKEPEGVAKDAPLVHAIVVSWNGAHLLSDCLRALLSQEAPARLHPVVVDNGSADGTTELLLREFPSVEHLRLETNLGYGRANNQAMRRALDAGADYVGLINNDVELEPGWLARLLEAAQAQPQAGLFTGTLLLHGGAGSAGVASRLALKGAASEEEVVNSTGLVVDGFGRVRDRDFRVPLRELSSQSGPVAGVSGAAALLRAQMLREVGLFDPAYFAYYEDADLSLRAAEHGFSSWYVREATARHRFGASFGRGSAQQRYLLARGHLRTVGRHQPLLKAAVLVAGTVAYRLAVKAPVAILKAQPAIALAELRGAGAGALDALRALAPRIGGKKPDHL